MVRLLIIMMLWFQLGACKVIGGGKSTALTERVTERFKDTTVLVSGESVTAPIADSAFLAFIVGQLATRDTFYMPSSGGQTTFKYYYNSKGQLEAECASKDRFITFLLKELETERLRSENEVIIQEVKGSPHWGWLLIIGAETMLLLLILFKNLINLGNGKK